MTVKNRNKIAIYFSFIFLSSIFIIGLSFSRINSVEIQASVNQNLVIPSNWTGCSEVPGNVNNPLTNVNSGGVIGAFWNALLGMKLGETKSFIVPVSQHPYTDPPLGGKDLFYIVRIDNIDSPIGGIQVTSDGQVDVFYSLYIDCTVSSGSTTEPESTSSSVPPTTSSSSQDNTIPLLAGLGIGLIVISSIGYFEIIKPRTELPQDTKIIEEKQARKQMNQTKELLDLIQDKKETTDTKKVDSSLSKPKSSKKPRRR